MYGLSAGNNMQSKPYFGLYTYSEYLQHTQVINLNQIEHLLWLRIPDDVASRCTLYRVECSTTELIELNHGMNFISREGNRPWLSVKSEMIDKMEGFHSYKLSFIDLETDDIVALYFSYNIQNNNPVKPYKYMKDGNTHGIESEFLTVRDDSRYERHQ